MKGFMSAILITIFLAAIIFPVVEMLNVFQKKMVLNTAVFNALRSSATRSINEMDKGELNAVIKWDTFLDNFLDSMEQVLDLTLVSRSDSVLVFKSNTEQFNNITVELSYSTDDVDESEVTVIEVHAYTVYNYRTKLLKMADEAGGMADSVINVNQEYLVDIIN